MMYATVGNLERRVWAAYAFREHRDAAAVLCSVPVSAGGDGDGSWVLEHRPEAAGAARRVIRAVLDGWQVGADAAESVVLVVSELVTNAVEHAEPPVILHLHREPAGRQVWVGVTDGGPAATDGGWTTSCTGAEHGRGLDIVDTLTTGHGTRTYPGGRATHWARLPAWEAA
ncbi:ATP-binding protein [Streptomyces sp. NPDC059718]